MAEYTYQDEIFQVDNSNGCYLEVTYRDLKGYVGVNLRPDATDETPYLFVMGRRASDAVTEDGLRGGRRRGDSIEDALNGLCDWLLKFHRNRSFDREKHCRALNEFVGRLA